MPVAPPAASRHFQNSYIKLSKRFTNLLIKAKVICLMIVIAMISAPAFWFAGNMDETSVAVQPDNGAIVAGNVTGTEVNESIDDAVEWLFSAQKANGGLKPWEGYSITNLHATSWTIMAWLCAGYNFSNGSVSDALDYVRSKDQGDGTYEDDPDRTTIGETRAGMVIEYLAGGNVSDSQEWMLGKADEDGKFGTSNDYYKQMNALRGLIWTGISPFNETVKLGLQYLIDNYADSADERDLAEIMEVMVSCGYSADHPFIVDNIEDILSTQKSDGSWDHDNNPVRFTAEIVWRLGYLGIGPENESIDRAVEYVLGEQNGDGSWDAGDGTDCSLAVTSAIAAFTTQYAEVNGPWGNVIEIPTIDVQLDDYDLLPGDHVNITAVAPGDGNISVEVQDPSGSSIYLWTEETVDLAAEFEFTLDNDTDNGTYHVYATTDNGSAVGQSIFDVGVVSGTYDDIIQDAADWMFSVQMPSGGLKKWEGENSESVSGTTNAIYGWFNAGYNFTNGSVSDALDYIRSELDTDGSYNSDMQETSKGTIASHMDGYDVSESQKWIASQQNNSTGSFGGVDLTQMALKGLLITGVSPFNDTVMKGVGYLLENGMDESVADKQTLVIQVLLTSGYSPDLPAIADRIDWAVDLQRSDGSWYDDNSPVSATGLNVNILGDAGLRGAEMLENATDYLIDEQNDDGSWTSGAGSKGAVITSRCMIAITETYMNHSGFYGSAVVLPESIDVRPARYLYNGTDEIFINTTAHEYGNVTLTVEDPDGTVVFNGTEWTDGLYECTFNFTLEEGSAGGTYHVFAVTDKNDSIGRSMFDVEVEEPEPTELVVTITVIAPDNVTAGSNFTVTVSIWSSVDGTVTGALQVLDPNKRAI